jgi:LPS sulfotransferase NodH
MTISEHFQDFIEFQSSGFAGISCDKPVVMIAMTPRTGSSHLCAALQAAGDVGRWHDWAPLADGLKMLFPRLQLVYLDRRDVIAQAVSLFRAEITNHWARRPGEKVTQAEALDDKFDLRRIKHIVDNLVSEKTQWELYFAAQELTPARLFYESFVHDIGHALRFFTQHTGLDLKPEIAPDAGYEKLADRLSDEWVDRMRRHVLQMT